MYSVFARLIFSLEGRRIALQKLNIASVTQHKRWRTSNVELSERSASWATELVNSCSESERKYLCDALQKVSTGDSQLKDSPPISFQHLRLVFLASATPFIGFGFVDNFIMIIAGEYIDLTLAAVCGFSTMAAAGIGNLISDLCGLGLVGYVERYARLFGVKSPALTESQLKSNRVRRYSNLGRMCGITLGCLIGMMPLLFFPGDEKGIEGKKKFVEFVTPIINKTADN
ncbi:unnamed protein product [Hymenolepis diminuta]|uniref:Transmembrane protein 65 n=1 Tax=Hymenolepis diminuta TaxID=6216 RepID=A0A564YMR1_HYMDI|nr:unnamed protein product [Hymenolepis diminuta]